MTAVLHGFTVILAVIAAGYLAARFGVVRGEQRQVLNNVAFYVATPALLFGLLRESSPAVLVSPVILVSVGSALAAAAIFVLVSKLWFARDLATTTLGAASAGYVNANGLGLPIAIYILGDASYVAPLVFVQLVLFVPLILTILEVVVGGAAGLRGGVFALGNVFRNPVIIASVAGFLVSLFEVRLPSIMLDPIEMLGAAAIPMTLLSFGASLRGQRVLRRGEERIEVICACVIKMLVMPVLAWAAARMLGFDAHLTFATVIAAALPSAQNVYVFAAVYRRAEIMVRDTVLLTTLASLPIVALLSLLLAG